MTEPPACCTPGTSVHDVAEMMAQHDCGAVPVVEGADGKHVFGVALARSMALNERWLYPLAMMLLPLLLSFVL